MSYVDPVLAKLLTKNLKKEEIQNALDMHYDRLGRFIQSTRLFLTSKMNDAQAAQFSLERIRKLEDHEVRKDYYDCIYFCHYLLCHN